VKVLLRRNLETKAGAPCKVFREQSFSADTEWLSLAANRLDMIAAMSGQPAAVDVASGGVRRVVASSTGSGSNLDNDGFVLVPTLGHERRQFVHLVFFVFVIRMITASRP
jgi:hypothetical protein